MLVDAQRPLEFFSRTGTEVKRYLVSLIFIALIVAYWRSTLPASQTPTTPPPSNPAHSSGKGDPANFRKINIVSRSNAYTQWTPQVIVTRTEFEALSVPGLHDVPDPTIKETLDGAEINFDTDALILITDTEGSGSNVVELDPPTHQRDRLIFEMKRDVPKMGTTDMAYYCFAFVVKKADYRHVELWITTDGVRDGSPAWSAAISTP